MITMQQLEELENRVIKALHLIGELRSENSKLENENESLKGEVEDVKLSLEEKEHEIERVKRDLELATKELKDLKDKEDNLEKKIISLLGKLDVLQSGSATVELYSETPSSGGDVSFKEPAASKTEDRELIIESESELLAVDDVEAAEKTSGDLKVETVEPAKAVHKDEDDEIIIIDDEDEISHQAEKKTKGGESASHDEDEIILLDDEDEIVIEDVHDDEIIIDEEDFEVGEDTGKEKKAKALSDDDDEIIIIEDDDVK